MIGCLWLVAPWALMLEPLLFVSYVNDLNVDVGFAICKFPDDTKIAGIVDNAEGILR